ncbi:Tetratricopeptide repeat, putative [Trypanosoma equiperdum]|uniref:Tetratricopeptide repeat protein n=3 Tax=Trypanozoon TaxID=39700 RepID=Q585T0_TRYB2|nr:hypothetical protein, conserved [Trypanosoma brucei gambiense DAL972]XP_951516.1 hypothetical protein, conserved [Trypanosoma brucei brucei TREU927]AAX79530.1 hypothetical protein, conserved [Trypanosoma brucei]SCU71418.1 Tetratricopeptide repeat, putative [Trypanosoma equiperdum]AAQ15643.1 hypothetical protein, conserved [Trypanosoma brucei brucei TREU927]CBH09330.1 hypothetical protein, conserved [Trypanosoma brucei gambiense DAL972]|eukprot:XP_011771638.1 hypothetical protein, conserved [Trypanosoma brucei gambiense DAL972]
MAEGGFNMPSEQRQLACARVRMVDGIVNNNSNLNIESHSAYSGTYTNGSIPVENNSRPLCDAEGGKTIVSNTRRRYTVLPSASQNLLKITDLRSIERYIELNKNHRFMDRDPPPAEVIPDVPFVRVCGGDEVLQMAVKPIHRRESALDVPLRFVAPECFHIPPLEDAPSYFPLARRIAALLKGAESVQPRWLERRPDLAASEATRGVVEVRVLKEAEVRRRAAVRAGNVLAAGIQFCTTASLHYNSGNMELARASFTKALVAFEAAGDVRGVALCHNLLGICHYRLQEYKVSLLHHKQQESVGGCYARAVAQINMGVCYAALGELDFAEAALEDALANARACENSMLETVALGNQGLTYLRMGNMRAAQASLEQCLERCSLAGDKSGASICLLLLGELYSLIQDHSHALFYFEHAYRVGGEAGCADVVDLARVNIGISRGTGALRDAMILQAKRMGVKVGVKDVVSLLPS